MHPEDRIAHARAFGPLISGETAFVRHRHRVVTASGAVRWAEVRAQLMLSEDGEPECIAGVIEDVTDEHRAQQYGSAERAVLDLLAGASDKNLGDALDPRGALPPPRLGPRRALDARRRPATAWSSPAAGAATAARAPRSSSSAGGLPTRWATACPGLAWAQRTPVWSPDISADERLPRRAEAAESGLRSAMALPIAKGQEPLARRAVRLARAARARARHGAPAGVDRRPHRPVRRALAPARPAALDRAHRPADRARQPPRLGRRAGPRAGARAPRRRPLCLAILDLDHFKRFNDAHGHQAGDRLLEDAAREWSGRLRATDMLARYGGEEFAVLLPHCDTDTAEAHRRAAARRRPGRPDVLRRHRRMGRRGDRRSAVARADAALYMAKRAGRAQAVLV